MFDDLTLESKLEEIKNGINLDKHILDEDWEVRMRTVEQGYGLDQAIHDDNWHVRAAVVKQGYKLEEFLFDEDFRVRMEVAKQKFGLYILINDKSVDVLQEVMKHGFDPKYYTPDPKIEAFMEKKRGQARVVEMIDGKSFWNYKSPFSNDTYKVTPVLDMYTENDNLYMGFQDLDPEYGLEPFTDVTVNVGELPYLYSAIDTNNNGEHILSFLEENGFGELTGDCLRSGYCTYPVFKFKEEFLEKIDPEFMKEYRESHNIEERKASLTEKIAEADVMKQDVTDRSTPERER